jgi:hypothetical protein
MRISFYKNQVYQYAREMGNYPPDQVTMPVPKQCSRLGYYDRPVAPYEEFETEDYRRIDLWRDGARVHQRYVLATEYECERDRLIVQFNRSYHWMDT